MGAKSKSIYEMELPQKYRDGLIAYVDSLDGGPDDYKMIKMGFARERREKLVALYSIEALKHMAAEGIDGTDADDAKQAINQMINEYNAVTVPAPVEV